MLECWNNDTRRSDIVECWLNGRIIEPMLKIKEKMVISF